MLLRPVCRRIMAALWAGDGHSAVILRLKRGVVCFVASAICWWLCHRWA